MKKIIFFILVFGYCLLADNRISTATYEDKTVMQVKATLGHYTVLELAKDEYVTQKPRIGFERGWNVTHTKNYVYIKPITYIGEMLIDIEQPNGTVIQKVQKGTEEPTSEWNTNLFIKTNKRFYVIDLIYTFRTSCFRFNYMVIFNLF
jgi:type IV secretory pathway VirB9-like protein